MRIHLSILFSLSVMIVSPASLYAQDIQNWEISILDQNQRVQSTATMQCLIGGACDASSWHILTMAEFGCDYKLDFSVQFSGDAVRLLLFKTTFDTTCSTDNLRLLFATGSGYADRPYPTANTASGEVDIGFEMQVRGVDGRTITHSSTGTTRWEARRL